MDTLDDSRVAAAPTPLPERPGRRHRRRLIALAGAGALVIALLDGWLLWQSSVNRIPAVIAAPAPEPARSAKPSATPAPTRRATPVTTPAPTAASTTIAPAAPGTVDSGWVTMIAARTGIPARAVTAYANAQLAMAAAQPGCHIDWTMLAGIGAVESGHGRSHGSTLRPDGVTTLRILGPALDGTHGNRAIAATPLGLQLDGDPRWDHAVGPMQFIPSTWSHWGTSAGGGVPDPNDIDDAVLTAARYLCAAGGDLSTAAGWRAAVGAYNAPIAYAIKVTGLANTYARESQAS